MTHEQIDPRVRRTHELIHEAFLELAAECGFEAMTVGDIVKRAGVNRATFYRHYQDKYDLLDRIFQQATSQFVTDLGPPGEVVQSINSQDPPERWVKFFEHFAEHERLYGPLLGRKGSSWFAAKMRDYCIQLLADREMQRAQLAGFQEKPFQSKMPSNVAMTLVSNLLVSTIAWWLESGKQYSPKQIASWFLDLAANGYVYVLGL